MKNLILALVAVLLLYVAVFAIDWRSPQEKAVIEYYTHYPTSVNVPDFKAVSITKLNSVDTKGKRFKQKPTESVVLKYKHRHYYSTPEGIKKTDDYTYSTDTVYLFKSIENKYEIAESY